VVQTACLKRGRCFSSGDLSYSLYLLQPTIYDRFATLGLASACRALRMYGKESPKLGDSWVSFILTIVVSLL